MSFLQAIFLGAVQGIAEFLPISSSGHLSIFQNLFHMQGIGEVDLFFDVLLHFGTLIAVFVAYWSDIRSIVSEFFTMVHLKKSSQQQTDAALSRRMFWLLIVGTLPLLAAILFKDKAEMLYSNLFFIGFALLLTGTLLFVSDRYRNGEKSIKDATVWDALIVGIGQMIAVVPGLSRSGTTISAGLFRGFDRTFAVKFSFLLSIPAVLGANLLSLIDAIKEGIDWSLVPCYLAGMAVAAILGYGSILLLKKIARSKTFGGFSFYCWGAGLVTLFLALIS